MRIQSDPLKLVHKSCLYSETFIFLKYFSEKRVLSGAIITLYHSTKQNSMLQDYKLKLAQQQGTSKLPIQYLCMNVHVYILI